MADAGKLMRIARTLCKDPRWDEGESQNPYVELRDGHLVVFDAREADLVCSWEAAERKIFALYEETVNEYLTARRVVSRLYRSDVDVAVLVEGSFSGVYPGSDIFDAYTRLIHVVEAAEPPTRSDVLLALVSGITRSPATCVLDYRFLSPPALEWTLGVYAQGFTRRWAASTPDAAWSAAILEARAVAAEARDRLERALAKSERK